MRDKLNQPLTVEGKSSNKKNQPEVNLLVIKFQDLVPEKHPILLLLLLTQLQLVADMEEVTLAVAVAAEDLELLSQEVQELQSKLVLTQ